MCHFLPKKYKEKYICKHNKDYENIKIEKLDHLKTPCRLAKGERHIQKKQIINKQNNVVNTSHFQGKKKINKKIRSFDPETKIRKIRNKRSLY